MSKNALAKVDDTRMDDEEICQLAEDYELRVARANAPKREKNAWIALARRFFEPGNREPCAVCSKFRVITQAHHIVPLEAQFDSAYRTPDHRYVWLCPNHHELVHIVIGGAERRKTALATSGDLSDEEFKRLMHIFGLSASERK